MYKYHWFRHTDGHIFNVSANNICGLGNNYCRVATKVLCSQCKLRRMEYGLNCTVFTIQNPQEAAEIMGFEYLGATDVEDLTLLNLNKPEESNTMYDTNKPVMEWTLDEVRQYCTLHGCNKQCRFYNKEANTNCEISSEHPNYWNFTDKPKWTDGEIQWARNIKALYNSNIDGMRIVRSANDDSYALISDSWNATINSGLFPTLESGQSVLVSDIVDCGVER